MRFAEADFPPLFADAFEPDALAVELLAAPPLLADELLAAVLPLAVEALEVLLAVEAFFALPPDEDFFAADPLLADELLLVDEALEDPLFAVPLFFALDPPELFADEPDFEEPDFDDDFAPPAVDFFDAELADFFAPPDEAVPLAPELPLPAPVAFDIFFAVSPPAPASAAERMSAAASLAPFTTFDTVSLLVLVAIGLPSLF